MPKDEHYRQKSKDRLTTSTQKKIRTTMIGSLCSIEDHLGFLWGHNSNEPLTEQQEEFRNIYEELRTEILDKGNIQIKEVVVDLSTYDVTWNRYRYQIPVTPLKTHTVIHTQEK